MDGTFKARTLVESPEFTDQLSKIEKIERVDEALRGLMTLIAVRPDAFPIVPGTEKLRLAKSDRYEGIGGVVPRLRLWFVADENQVNLLYIEVDTEDRLN